MSFTEFECAFLDSVYQTSILALFKAPAGARALASASAKVVNLYAFKA
jgi:hypothetical protein